MLDKMRQNGIRYIFVSNSDNLGAWLDTAILGYFARNDIPFLMEVVERTDMDRKGGHLARNNEKRLILREIAQTAKEDLESFQNIDKYVFFNTNNIWINLDALCDALDKFQGVLPLPIIKNEKYLNPRDSTSPRVYQVETAMGAAIGLFSNARVVESSRIRFCPVKNSEDLLVAQSDYYLLDDNCVLTFNPERKQGTIEVKLDSAFYGIYDEMVRRFPHGAPSLLHCKSLEIKGDVRFENDVRLKGEVKIENKKSEQAVIEAGSRIEGELVFQ
jgi:UTP--glucose-1-phosphate uridylyltransferase